MGLIKSEPLNRKLEMEKFEKLKSRNRKLETENSSLSKPNWEGRPQIFVPKTAIFGQKFRPLTKILVRNS